MYQYTTAGSVTRPWAVNFDAESDLEVSTGSTSVPLTGTIPVTTTEIEAIVAFIFKTDPSATVGGVRLVITSVATGKPLYYFPSKSKYLAGV